jgi:hypothetical protein
MRIVTTTAVLAAAAVLAVSLPADAQNYRDGYRPRAKIIVQPKRSYLDAGTAVRPGERRYHDYIYSPALLYPPYGPRTYPYAAAARWPLPSFGDVPGF